ncbi:predicted protein [Nematostella vectensis]|uniref:Uncharacterized protein n=1 Tax=Nematostella vectensis TaxID=45351 RepID=A7RY45_NEMVE|nr:ectonucleotide pyrophosphatase/phosphodiesterase family member 5 [Nematostella vectensis]XP_032241092.1 ectonucleotide pyrophosphatase/phosphodiesterase family member 5 [Nematostella vectensis]EDO43633.1 predicted protein [Nematostella vectensis]|eukprot:XP_001635696.1 predicted protein [Nematostella vectensis]
MEIRATARKYEVTTSVILLTVILISEAVKNSNTVILLSFDGFRWDFASKAYTPNLDFIAMTGVRAPYVEPVFPVETFPNHYSMVTGLYPESHGILSGCYMYDPVMKESFENMNNSDSRWWDGGEPVWVTNQKQGRSSGVCNFPGFDVKIRGHFPTYSTSNMGFNKPFLTSTNIMTFKQQIDVVMDWLTGLDPPSFVAIYFNQPDMTSHGFGPNSDQVIEQIKRCDNITGYLIMRLLEKRLFNSVNLVLTGDHGQTDYNTTKFLNLENYFSAQYYIKYGVNTLHIWPRPNVTKSFVYENFKRIEYETKLLRVFKTEEMPEAYHYKNNRRAPPIIAIMEEHWVANTTKFWEYWNRQHRNERLRGDHNYSPFIPSMRPFFLARGPNFKEGFVSEPLKMVDIYPLLCNILDVAPAPNNGSFERVKKMLKAPNPVKRTNNYMMRAFFRSFWKGMVDML